MSLEQQQRQQLEGEKLLTLRRHTMGPGQTPMYLEGGMPNLPLPYPHQGEHILPQTNLMTLNLPMVSNLPPENFSVKDPHLLKPPAALGVMSQHGRRASDGGAYFGQFPAEAPPSMGSSHSSGEDSAEQLCYLANQTLLDANAVAVAAAAAAAGASGDSLQPPPSPDVLTAPALPTVALPPRPESPNPFVSSIQFVEQYNRSGLERQISDSIFPCARKAIKLFRLLKVCSYS